MSCRPRTRNDTAAYLAQRTQLGSGNTSAPVVAHNEAARRLAPAQYRYRGGHQPDQFRAGGEPGR